MSYWKPIETIDRGEINLKQTTSHRNKHLPISYQRQLLPISRYRQEVLYCVERYRTVILVGETGCGKSTQIPQYLFESGWSSGGYGIVCTQPRRLAAISVCNRVCEEIGCSVGETVGYAVRFDSKCGLSTAIKYCTDGVLLRETMSDPLLTKYSVIMVDEAHERSLHSDILLGLLKKIMRKRQDLHIIIASAGLDAMLLKNFFETNKTNDIANDTSYVMSVTGRLHSVDILYLQDPTANYIRCAVNTVLNIHYNEERGDILVFLPGAEEIDSAIDLLESLYTNKNDSNDLFVLPLYSSLPHALQQRVFDVTPPTHRKVIFATNIAETSVTIEGIRYVVDSGFVKLNYFNVYNGIDALVTCNISKASSNQRAGRAGRTQPGKCFRLLTKSAYVESLPEYTPPEMQRTEISWVVIQLKALGIDDVLHFDFLSPPPADAMIYALELLFALGALDSECRLTRVGEIMAEMPIEPRMSKCLLSSVDMGCSEDILSIVAMCSVEYPFITQRSKASQESKDRLMECVSHFTVLEGDHMTLLRIYKEFLLNKSDHQWCDSMCLQHRILSRAKELRSRLALMMKSFSPEGTIFSSCEDDTETIRKCLVSGYFSNAAQLGAGGKYWTIRGHVSVDLHANCVFSRFGTLPEWVIFHDVIHTSNICIREVSRIEPRWLLELAQHYYHSSGKR